MASTAEALATARTVSRSHWKMRVRQFNSVVRIETRKNFIGWRAVPLYLVAAAPVGLLALFSIFASFQRGLGQRPGELNIALANLYEGLILRNLIFFGCAWMFMNLFRGEIVDKSLHYYMLTPMRREVLVGAKYASGLIASSVLFSFSTIGAFIFAFVSLGYPEFARYELSGAGLSLCANYVVITLLACVGYGSVFLLIGLWFRNPIIPGLVIYGWEWINFLLPPGLKKISIVHYLHSMSPVAISEGPFALVGEPTPKWLCVAGLLAVSAVWLVLAGWRARRIEIKYGSE